LLQCGNGTGGFMNAVLEVYAGLCPEDTLDDLSEEDKETFDLGEVRLFRIDVHKLLCRIGFAESMSAAARLRTVNAVKIDSLVAEDRVELVPTTFVLRAGKCMKRVTLLNTLEAVHGEV
jgi:hypothetical protein